MLTGERLERVCIGAEMTLRQAMQTLEKTSAGVLLMTAPGRILIDTITDGDIRRAILEGRSLDDRVDIITTEKSMSGIKPVAVPSSTTRERLRGLMRDRVVRQIPLIAEDGSVQALATFEDLFRNEVPSFDAVIMAGGFGKRLHPLTEDTPKPMLPVGDRPLLERTIESLKTAGIGTIHITTHFAAEKIREHFGDGSSFGVNVCYVEEDKPMGTAGSLRQLSENPNPFLVINGDILTHFDFRKLCRFHEEHDAEMTVCVRQYDFEVPYGVVECASGYVTALREKPSYSCFVNAGVYLVEPNALDLIPGDAAFHMTDLISALLERGGRVASFPILEYWIDIGCLPDYERAQAESAVPKV